MSPWATDVDVLPAGGYARLPYSSSDVLPLPQYLPRLDFNHQYQTGRREFVWAGQEGMGLPAGTEPQSLPTTSPNMYVRSVDYTLMRVGTTASVSSIPPVGMMMYL